MEAYPRFVASLGLQTISDVMEAYPRFVASLGLQTISDVYPFPYSVSKLN